MRKKDDKKAAAEEFTTRPVHAALPYDPEDYELPRRPKWADRAKEELELAMELDLEPDRRVKRPRPTSYERVAAHLKEKGYD